MPNRWLVKTDPTALPLEVLSMRTPVTWTGVTQPASLIHLRTMRRGEEVFVYHTGRTRAVVATARVRKGAYPDPDDPSGRLVLVDLSIRGPLDRPVPLAELRGVPALDGWDLLRIPRLLVMPVPAAAWRKVLSLARRKPSPKSGA